jgi:two-component system, OmpR family, response regulator
VDQTVRGKLRVLVVESEPIAREILADLLKMAGYDVLATHSGEHALLTLVRERGRLDCLFTAVELPGLVDGWMLAEEFRALDATRPVVFATGSEPAAPRGSQAAFVARPVLPPKAVEAVNAVTGRSQAALEFPGLTPRVVAESAAAPAAEVPPQAEFPEPLRRVG